MLPSRASSGGRSGNCRHLHARARPAAEAAGPPSPPASSTCSTSSAWARCRSPSAETRAPGGPLIHTIRAVGPVTQRALRAEGAATCSACAARSGAPWPVGAGEGKDVVIVAGGIGLAPLRPAIYHILARRKLFGRVVLLVRRAHAAGPPLPRGWSAGAAASTSRSWPRWTAPTGDWRGDVGVVTTLIPRATFDPLHAVAFVCGPEVMMRFAAKELLGRGVPPAEIFALHGTQHEVRRRPLRSLPARAALRLQGRAGLPLLALEPLLKIREV